MEQVYKQVTIIINSSGTCNAIMVVLYCYFEKGNEKIWKFIWIISLILK